MEAIILIRSELRRWISPLARVGVTCSLFAVSFLGVPSRGERHNYLPAANQSLPVAGSSTQSHAREFPITGGTDVQFSQPDAATGLSKVYARQILHDDRGFMWFGTLYGLVRFDGYDQKIFAREQGNPASLGGISVNALFKDHKGNLWVACDQTVNRFVADTETFVRYPIPAVQTISEDKAGIVWLSSANGLYRLDPSSGRIKRYFHDPADASSLSDDAVKYSDEDRSGEFWVATGNGLDRFDRQTGKVKLHIAMDNDSPVVSFHEDRAGRFWVFRSTHVPLALLDREKKLLTPVSLSSGGRNSILGVEAMVEDRNGTLWMGTTGAGILRFDSKHSSFQRFDHDADDPDSIPQNNVMALAEDGEGGVWAALSGMGVVRFSTSDPPFRDLNLKPKGSLDSSETLVNALYQDSEGVIWASDRQAIFRRKSDQKSEILDIPSQFQKDVVAIDGDKNGNLWFGTLGHGLIRYNPRSREIVSFRHDAQDPHSLSSDLVTRLLFDRKGALWVATWDGLNRLDPGTNNFHTYRLSDQGAAPKLLDIIQDQAGVFWLATRSSGLLRFEPETGRSTYFQHDETQGSLSDNHVNKVFIDRSGTLWIATQDGLNKFDPPSGRFQSFSAGDGLPGHVVDCIVEDSESKLWMGTDDGIASLEPKTHVVKVYSTNDGLPGPNWFGWASCFRGQGDELYFAGFSGATSFSPKRVVDDQTPPPLVLTNFRLFGGSITPGASPILKQAIDRTQSITLTHDQSVFSLEFAALSYADPLTTRYRFMLEGLDHGWNALDTRQRIATYTTLPAGSYTFRVQGAINRGPWSEPGAQLVIHVLPPWWATAWFRMFAVAFIAFVGIAAYRYRTERLALALSARFKERLDERTRIAREVHDTLLQTIQGTRMVADNALTNEPSTPEMQRILGQVSSWMVQASEEARAAMNSLRSPNPTDEGIVQLIEGTVVSFRSRGPMEVSVAVEGEAFEVHPVVKSEVVHIFREALRNAYQHSEASRLSITLEFRKGLRLCVKDDGVGIEANVLQTGRSGHFGLQGMRERAQRIHSDLRIVSTPTTGTLVDLRVPSTIAFLGAERRRPFRWLINRFIDRSAS